MPVISSLIFAPFKLLANRIYKSADAICAVSETYVNRALSVNKKCKSGTAVFLGTELATFDKNAKENEAPEKGKDEIWLAYCGSMGDSYDLGCVIDALALLDNPPKFIAIGNGQKKDEFEKYAKEKNVNCLFTGKLPYEQMCAYLCACDITVNPIVGNSAASIINKHADYAASGLPVINTQESDEYRRLVDEYEMGFNCRNGDASDLAEKIKILVDDADLRKRMGKNARRCAEERFDRANTYSALAGIICKQNGA
ncbi:MAG: glycosyltransferase [Clostridia bacterium]|nr:glycosyltransferase [Clostridia bacterium]